MPKACGIEINRSKIKLCVTDYTAKKPRILGYVEAAIPEEQERTWEERAGATLKELLARLKIPYDAVAMSVDSSECLVRELTLPYKKDEQIRQVYKGQFANLIHDYDIDDLVVDYFKIGETEKETSLIAIGVPKEILARNLAALQKAGVDPITIDIDVIALFNALYNCGVIEPQETVLIIHGSLNRFAKFILVENDRVKAVRAIRFLVPSMSKAEMDEYVQSREWKTETVAGPIPVIIVDESEQKEIDLEVRNQISLSNLLQKEILRFITAYASQDVSYVLLTGDFEQEQIRARVQPHIPIPVKTVNILESIDHPFQEDSEQIRAKVHVPLGLALKAGDVDVLKLEYRKEDFLYRKRYGKIKAALTVMFELLIVLISIVGLYLYFNKYRIYEAAYKDVLALQRDAVQGMGLDEAPDEELYNRLWELHKKKVSAVTGAGPLEKSALQIIAEMFQAVTDFYQQNNRNENFYCSIERVNADQSGGLISLEVKVKEPQYGQMLLDGLRRNAFFSGADFKETRTEGGFIKYTIAVSKERK